MFKRAVAASLTVSFGLLLSTAVDADEGGGGHYTPGTTADFFNVLSGVPGFSYANFVLFYQGSAGRMQPQELGGVVAVNVKAKTYGDTSFLLYQTPLQIFGAQYAAAIAIPHVWVDLKGNVQTGLIANNVHDTTAGIGDIQIFPLMLVWSSGELKWGTNFSVFAPTGEFRLGDLANTSKNYWTFEPTVYVSRLSSKSGIELSAFAGIDLDTRNGATDYQSGADFHLDVTGAQHISLFGGRAGLGANFFYYQQFTADSGSGATLGSFEGRTVGIGPVASYFHNFGPASLAAEAKWLPELDVEHRNKGNIAWFKIGVSVPF